MLDFLRNALGVGARREPADFAVFVATRGDVSLRLEDGSAVKWVSVEPGTVLPYRNPTVLEAGTTASFERFDLPSTSRAGFFRRIYRRLRGAGFF